MLGRQVLAPFVAAVLVLVGVGLAAAQPPFRITYHREGDEPSSIVLTGEVVNDSARDLVDVWVSAQAENARGQVVCGGMAFVTSFLPGHGTTTFTIKLPAEDARSFRLAVSSFRYASASTVESP